MNEVQKYTFIISVQYFNNFVDSLVINPTLLLTAQCLYNHYHLKFYQHTFS